MPVTVSEAHGYGMLIAVSMADYDSEAKDLFDGMVRYYLAHPSQIGSHLMAWQQSDTGSALLKMVSYHLTKGEQLENILNNTFKEIEDITDVHQMTNQQLKRLIQKIEVDKDGNVDIYLRLLGDLGLDESVLIEENETVLNCDDQT